MGISFKIDAAEGIVYAMAEGTIGLEEIQAARNNLMADPSFSPDFVTIVELRLSDIKLSNREIETLALSQPGHPTRKVAIVVVGAGRELFLRYKELVKGKPAEVFSDLGSAKKWVISD